MDTKKDIGKAFKERLSDFEKSPVHINWNDIESVLDKENNHKTVTRWKTAMGILVLAISVISIAFWNYQNTSNIEIDNNINNKNQVVKNECDKEHTATTPKTIHLVDNNYSEEGDIINSEANQKNGKTYKLVNQKNGKTYKLVNQKKLQKTIKQNNNKKHVVSYSLKNPKAEKTDAITINKENTFPKNRLTQKKQITTTTNPDTVVNKNNIQHEILTTIPENNSKRTSFSDQKPYKSNNHQKKIVPAIDSISHTSKTLVTQTGTATKRDKNAKKEQEVAERTIPEKTAKDTLIYLLPLKKKDTLTSVNPLKRKNAKKISFSIHLIPTYNIAKNGSLISDQLANNIKNSELTLGYGGVLTTSLTNKTGLRIGYNRLKINTKTNGINSDLISNTTDTFPNTLLDTGILLSDTMAQSISNQESIDLTQRLEYHEISAAINYNLINTKYSLSLISGISFLVLQKKDIILHSGSNDFRLRENSRIKPTNSSLNFGAGFKYQLFGNIHLTIEPLLNYQLQNASTNSKNYKPLYITIQTGLSLDF